MSNLEIFCITDKEVKLLKNTDYKPAAVGLKDLPKNYLRCDTNDNIFYKEKNYSELTFHYWFWKNLLDKYDNKTWIGFLQKEDFGNNQNQIIDSVFTKKFYIQFQMNGLNTTLLFVNQFN